MFSSYRRRFGTTKAVLILGSIYLVPQIIIVVFVSRRPQE
jgi:hypothetical protein